jgi:hypothetical protein
VHIGVQIEAPDGWKSLSKSVRYYYVGRHKRDDGKEKVLLAWFVKQKKVWRVFYVHISSQDFENALVGETKSIRVVSKQYNLPVWLSDIEGVNFEELESTRSQNKTQTYRQQVSGRFSQISELVELESEIITADNPLKKISELVCHDKSTHPHRAQVWFFSYILHGHDIWALKQPTHGNGKWSRKDGKHENKKFGRVSLDKGHGHGWPSSIMEKQIDKSYLSRCGLGRTMRKIHAEALIEDFKCTVICDENNEQIIIQKDNKPYPSYGQFRWVIVKKYGLAAVQTTVWGSPRVRQSAVVNEGNYTQQFANILENVEVDVYFVKERPKAMHSDEAMPALAVARAVCVTTGGVVGVGFSLGSETGDAYRSMLFCMAVPKAIVARIYGIPPEDLNWVMQGVPASFTSDRGPAGSAKLVSDLEVKFPIKTIVPSYSGQSKAVVESGHPRDVKLEGAPSYVQSDLNVVEMMKREIYLAARDNHTKDISGRLNDEAIHEFLQKGLAATPHNYWQYLDERLRTSAHSMTFENAVRAFCTPMEFEVDKDGVKFRHRWYISEDFKATGVQKKLVESVNIKLKGYVLNMAVRYIWVEVGGRLIELEAMRRSRVDGDELYVPLSALESTAEMLAAVRSKTRNSAEAARVDVETKFFEATGKRWNQGVRHGGSPKSASGTTAHEVKVANGKSNR